MNRIILILGTLMLFISDLQSQWYHRQYGADNIFQLTPEQFKESLRKAKGGVWTGSVMSAIGVAGIISGISVASSADGMGSEGEGRAFAGVILAMGSVPFALAGFTILGIYGTRAGKIKGILKNAEAGLTLINCPAQPTSGTGTSRIPGITITIQF